jgi:hypothetical protein
MAEQWMPDCLRDAAGCSGFFAGRAPTCGTGAGMGAGMDSGMKKSGIYNNTNTPQVDVV